MTPEEHQLLVETRQLAEQNAVMLQELQRSQRVSTVFKVIYWILVIALSFGAYYLIQPYVNTLKGAVSEITGNDALTTLGR